MEEKDLLHSKEQNRWDVFGWRTWIEEIERADGRFQKCGA
jgi:hypothetical protein